MDVPKPMNHVAAVTTVGIEPLGPLEVAAFGVVNGALHEQYRELFWTTQWEAVDPPKGVELAGPLTALAWVNDRYGVYALATDGNVYQRWYAPLSWSSWESIGAPSGPKLTSLSSVCWAPYRYGLYGLDAGGTVHQKWYSPEQGWSNWESLGRPEGKTLVGQVAAVSWAQYRYGIYAFDEGGSLYQRWFAPSSWSDWERLDGLPT